MTFPSGERYNYSIASSPTPGRDIVREFVDSSRKYNMTPGFYMLMSGNPYLVHETTSTYELNKVHLEQQRELWSWYGDLAEVWYDGGFDPAIRENVTALFNELQPSALAFNGPGTPIGPQDALQWIDSETGYAPYPNWMTTNMGSQHVYAQGVVAI